MHVPGCRARIARGIGLGEEVGDIGGGIDHRRAGDPHVGFEVGAADVRGVPGRADVALTTGSPRSADRFRRSSYPPLRRAGCCRRPVAARRPGLGREYRRHVRSRLFLQGAVASAAAHRGTSWYAASRQPRSPVHPPPRRGWYRRASRLPSRLPRAVMPMPSSQLSLGLAAARPSDSPICFVVLALSAL